MSNAYRFPAVFAVWAFAGVFATASSAAQSPGGLVETAAIVTSDDVPSAKLPSNNVPESVSQVRIVRLSEIRGTVFLDRNTGRGFESAYANIPLVRGSKLRTDVGLAEVEFEDNSTLRLAPETIVTFAELGRSANGETLTSCTVLKGMIYVNLGTRPGAFTLSAGASLLTPAAKSHLRVDLTEATTTVAVLDGSVDVAGTFGSTVMPKKRTMSFAAGGQPVIVAWDKVAPLPLDEWNKQGNDYQSRYANASFAGASAGYGLSDLNYYGSFADVPGCGSVWRPYFAGAAWDPYSAGTWAMYPGAGYSFVSPYPWGWLPYHSGAWQQCGAAGWGWSPSGSAGSWQGLNNIASLPAAGAGTTRIIHAPLRPPVGRASLVSVGMNTLEPSRMSTSETFTFRGNSAGLGVPREVFGNLGRASQQVERHGSAVTQASIGTIAAPAASGKGGAIASGATSSTNLANASMINTITNATHGASGIQNGNNTAGSWVPGAGYGLPRTGGAAVGPLGGGSVPAGGAGHK